MKSKLHMLMIFCLPILFAACSQESKIKDAVSESTKARVEASLREESAAMLPDRKKLQSIYVRVFLEKTEIEVDQIVISGSSATAAVTVRTVAPAIRASLREIIAKIAPGRQDAFNVPNALKLVAGQMNLGETIVTEKSTVRLVNQDGWKVPAPAVPAL
jgi:hypothetical protein